MMRRIAAFLLCVLMLAAVIPATLVARNTKDEDDIINTPDKEVSVSREILVTYSKGSSNSKKNKIAKDEGLEYSADIPELNTKIIKLPPGKSLADVKGLAKKYTEVVSVEENYIAYTNAVISPNDPKYISNMKNGYKSVHIEEMWGAVNSVSTVVAVLDTGVYAAHQDFSGRVLTGYDFVNNRPGAADDNGHGTRVAGFIAAEGNNGYGIAGVNWDVRILPVKVLSSNGTGTAANIAKGIIYAADQGADIINMSFGTVADSSVIRSAIEYAIDKGCILVAATGNSGVGTVEYPARYDNVIGVGAYTSSTGRASYSNFGSGLDIITFGSGITLTKAGSTGSAAGTSFAAPLVSGVLSLMKSVDPTLDNDSALDLVRQSAIDYGTAGWDAETGYGYLDFFEIYNTAVSLADQAPAADTAAPVITLQGDLAVELPFGSIYLEPGYTAIDNIDGDITDRVKTVGTINTGVAGSYILSYSVTDAAGNTGYASRTVTVLAAEELPSVTPEPELPAQEPDISIVGSSTIVLHQGSDYREQGALAADAVDGDLSASVKISGIVDVDKPGTYKITYSVTNSSGLAATAERRVQILAPTEKRERASYQFSDKLNKKKAGTVTKYSFSASKDGEMDLMLTLSGGVVNVTIRDASGNLVSSDQYASGTTKTYPAFAKGDYTLTVEAAKVNSSLSYTVNMLMPEVVYLTFDQGEVPLSDLSSDTVIIIVSCCAVVFVALTIGTAVLVARKRRKNNGGNSF